MRRVFGIVLGLFVLVSGGCAFTQANLNVKYDSEAARVGPLSSVKSVTLDIQDLVDKRPDKNRIGYKRNGFGQQTADIITAKPVPQIVKEALAAEFSKNGHLVSPTGSSLILSGDVSSFWFDVQVGFWTLQFMGTVGMDLKVVDRDTGNVLYTRSYQGHYNEESLGGLEGTWERVMNTALERMVRDVSTDSRLVEILKQRT
ncbi:MAG: YajG family lipoprotein [Syntrophobacteraceae bacterium]